jgi:hypothetical protein
MHSTFFFVNKKYKYQKYINIKSLIVLHELILNVNLRTVVHTYKPSNWETEQKDWEFDASMGYKARPKKEKQVNALF